MNRKHTIQDYHARITRVVDYVYDHLDEDLSSTKLAEIACFSEYHWHRIYRSISGETIAQTIRRLRLHRASVELMASEKSISEISKRAGYSAIESFSRAFQKSYGVPPASYRKDNRCDLYNFHQFEDDKMYDIEIESTESLNVIGYTHKGSFETIGKTFEQLGGWAFKTGKFSCGVPPRVFCIYYNDPTQVPEKELRSFPCMNFGDETKATDGIEETELVGGRYATLTFKGPYPELVKPYQWLFGKWLPESGEEVADVPCFEEYLNNPKETPASEVLTKI